MRTNRSSYTTSLANEGGSLGWGWVGAFILIIGVAAFLRFWQLDLRAIHHDESLHAYYSWKFFTGKGYVHDPMMHGPFQFFGNWLIFRLLGDSDYTARVLYAFLGTLLVALPLFLRRELGHRGALLASAMLAISPSLLYFSRFARNDIYIAFWSLLLVILLWRFQREGKSRYLLGAAAVLALSFATKETTFVFVAILASFFLLWRAGELWTAVRKGFSLSTLSPPASCFLLLLSLSLPLYAASISLFQSHLGLTLVNANDKLGPLGAPLGMKGMGVAIIAVLLLIELGLVLGLLWKRKGFLILFGIFWGIYISLFTTYLTNLAGLGTGIWGSLGYWLVQHSQNRLAQPWYYYLLFLSYYEFLPLVLGGVGAIYFLRQRDIFAAFLVYWAAASLLLYSLAGEKAPWLVIHIALPLILLAAEFGGKLIMLQRRWWRLAGLVGLAVLLAFTVKVSWQASYQKGDTPMEMLVYAGGSADLKVVRDRIEQFAQAKDKGKDLEITIDSSLNWPWFWYLRHYQNVTYADLSRSGNLLGGDVVLVAQGNEDRVMPYLQKYGSGLPFHQILWFPEEYKQWRTKDFMGGKGWGRWWGYFLNRRIGEPYYSSRGTAFFLKYE